MGRRRLEAGELGKVRYAVRAGGRVIAQAGVRDLAGKLHDISATEDTADAAYESLLVQRKVLLGGLSDRLTARSTVADATEGWLVSTTRRVSESSARTYRNDAKFMLRYIAGARLEDLGVEMVEAVIRKVEEDVLARRTQELEEQRRKNARSASERVRATLVMVLGYALDRGAVPLNYARAVKRLPTERRTSALTPDQWKRLDRELLAWSKVSHAGRRMDVPRLRQLLSLQMALGARIGELLALRRSDVRLDEGYVDICGTQLVRTRAREIGKPSLHRKTTTKSGNDRSLPLEGMALRVLKERLALAGPHPNSLLFPTANGGMVAANAISKNIRRFRSERPELFEELGIAPAEVTTHLLRRSLAQHLIDTEGVGAASEWIGHRDSRTTREFYNPRRSQVPRKYSKSASAFGE